MRLRALSLGAGVQSTTLALLAAHGAIPAPAMAIFADTQWEPRAVYDHLAWLESQLPFPIHRVTHGSVRENLLTRRINSGGSYASVPAYVINPDGSEGIGRRQCTHEYKLKPIYREIRRALGKTARNSIPAGTVTLLLGISLDEAHRVKDDSPAYVTKSYPLLDLRMTRSDCLGWLARHGYPTPPKSACIGCPYTSDRRWMERKANAPEEWQDAVLVDRALRPYGEYLHAARVPLDEVDFSRVDPDRQPDLFGSECEGLCGT